VQRYGPNLAATFLGVMLAIALVQRALDRQQQRLRAPAERAAISLSREVLVPIQQCVGDVLRAVERNEGRPWPSMVLQKPDVDRFVKLLEESDLGAPSIYTSGSIMEMMSQPLAQARRPWSDHVAVISASAPPRLAAAMEELMLGAGSEFIAAYRLGVQPAWVVLTAGQRARDGFATALVEANAAMSEALEAVGRRPDAVVGTVDS
jgi:hypothetical protein